MKERYEIFKRMMEMVQHTCYLVLHLSGSSNRYLTVPFSLWILCASEEERNSKYMPT